MANAHGEERYNNNWRIDLLKIFSCLDTVANTDSLTDAEMDLLYSEASKSPDSPDISFSAAASDAGVDYLRRGWRNEICYQVKFIQNAIVP